MVGRPYPCPGIRSLSGLAGLPFQGYGDPYGIDAGDIRRHRTVVTPLHPGDKLAVVNWERDGEVCCISLIKVEKLAEMVKGMLGPVIKDIAGK